MSQFSVTMPSYLYPVDKLPEHIQEKWKNGELRKVFKNNDGEIAVMFEDSTTEIIDPKYLKSNKKVVYLDYY